MGTNNKKYWKNFDELNNTPEHIERVQKEFQEEMPLDAFLGDGDNLSKTATPRRDFLKFLGFSVTAASLAACETPVAKVIPYVNKPEEITPGIANWYASSYYDGNEFASILVKTREGRPIFIEGNRKSPITKGGVNSRINSSVLSLYDTNRLKNPLENGEKVSWRVLDKKIKEELGAINSKGGKVRFLTSSIASPSTARAIDKLKNKYSEIDFKHVVYDAISYAGIIKANEVSFGKSVIPSYDFSKANVIVSVGADFLSNWLNSPEYIVQYADNRRPESKSMSKHYQFETIMSLTGTNADERASIKPSEQGKVLVALYNSLASKAGVSPLKSVSLESSNLIENAAKELWSNKGKSLVVCGLNDVNAQVLVNAINSLLQNYDATLDLNNPTKIKSSTDAEVKALVSELNNGGIDGLFTYNVNPSYSLPNAEAFNKGVEKVKLTVSLSDKLDETSKKFKFVAPDHHYLESWNDLNPVGNHFALLQPTISPLFDTRQAQQSFLSWADEDVKYYDFIRKTWETEIYSKQSKFITFSEFWNTSLHNGFFSLDKNPTSSLTFAGDVSSAANKLLSIKGGEFELALYTKAGIGDGSSANNPWLQELPDPVTKITWDNYVTMSPKQMREMNFSLLERGVDEATLVEVTYNGTTVKLPAVPQPGQAYGTIGIALGYGRTDAGKVADGVGQNVYPFVALGETNSFVAYEGVTLTSTSEKYQIAATQTHHTMMGREVVKEANLKAFLANPKAGNPDIKLETHKGPEKPAHISLWENHPVEDIGHRWGMTIDLSTCTGCSACVTACHSENNVPVVGKDEIRRGRDMHWLRIDRYYSSETTFHSDLEKKENISGLSSSLSTFGDMEKASENPEVVFQPIMCQHCNHAPCETVCPVAATTHSNEGMNQMTYNRCIGTRYCANNCPYKVRRFNWFNYIDNKKFKDFNPSAMDELTRMVLNPDVTVRSRGVMEKCSLCVQRIQQGKLDAKKAKKRVQDQEIQTACASACPTKAITFGDLNDKFSNDGKGSQVSLVKQSPRAYHLLEEVGTQPNIYYMTKIRNKEEHSA
jgi:MoCo/4Fe-4S cofactor protein with predicted Tat translocation signal